MKKNYVKMNGNKNYLSLGNLFATVKVISSNKSSAMQSEIFCTLFDISEINNTTVNNYCIGYRPIGVEYKRIFVDLKQKYSEDNSVFIPIIINLISILDEHVYKVEDNSLEIINSNKNLKRVCEELIKVANNDEHVEKTFVNKLKTLFLKSNLYECIIELLIYSVLENNQPLYIQDMKVRINKKELDEYLKIKLYEGISYITSLKELAKKNNMYANAELGSLEFDGLVSGKADYQKSYEYYLRATSKNHPKACWMVADLILTRKVGNLKEYFNIAWAYLERSVSLGSSAAMNTMGNCYMRGLTPENKIDKEKATEYYRMASELGYSYSYNNLGIICESDGLFEEALKYYKVSADLGESWALNKIGEYYRKQGDKKTAYIYYVKSTESPISERNYYSHYNLAKYYYLLNAKTKEKGIEYLKTASVHGVKKATELLKKYINL